MLRSALLNVMIQAARKAGRTLKRDFGEVEHLQVSLKGPANFVTAADRRAEEILYQELTKARPGYGFVGEEGGRREGSDKTHTWLVDPLDGTTNFAHHYPCFSVSIALAQRDTLLASAVFNPFYSELYSAARGEGATFNGKKIAVSKVATLSTSLLCTGFPTRNRKLSPNLQYYGEFTQRSHGVRRDGSAALDLASVASGRFDGFWEFGLNKWDVAAGILLIEESGGKVSDFEGQPYQLGGPLILATNGLIHEEMRKAALDISRRAKPLG